MASVLYAAPSVFLRHHGHVTLKYQRERAAAVAADAVLAQIIPKGEWKENKHRVVTLMF